MSEWQEYVSRLPLGANVHGQVARVVPFGVFVRAEDLPQAQLLAKVSRKPHGMHLPVLGETVEGTVVMHDHDLRQIHIELSEWAAVRAVQAPREPRQKYLELSGAAELAWDRIIATLALGVVVHGEVFEKLPMGVAFASIEEVPEALGLFQPEDQPSDTQTPEIGERFTARVVRHREVTHQIHLARTPTP